MVISRKTSRVGENSKLYVKNRSIHMGRSPNILKIPILSVFTYLYWHFSYQTKTTASPTSVFPASHYVTIANANSSSETATCDKGFITWRAGVGMGIEGHPAPRETILAPFAWWPRVLWWRTGRRRRGIWTTAATGVLFAYALNYWYVYSFAYIVA